MSEIRVDTISEKTSASGVTIDGLTIKDGNIIGDVALAGTTPTFTIGDAGAEDASLIFDGNAQDFYIALDDSADDLVIGTGSTVGSNVKMVIENGGNVGINDIAPDTLLHVNQGGEPPAEGMLILEANSASRQLRIQPPTNSDKGFIDFRGGNLTFQDDGTEVARFQGTTGFGIGITNVANKLDIATDSANHIRLRSATTEAKGLSLLYDNTNDRSEIRSDQQGVNQKDLMVYALNQNFGRNASDINFKIDDTGNVIVKGTNADLTFASSGNNINFARNSDNYVSAQGGTSSNLILHGQQRVVVQTASTERFRVTSAGIHIGGTGSANALDDYEEGTFTPTLTTSGNTDYSSVGYALQQGIYTKIGNRVNCSLRIQVNSFTQGSPSGNIRLAGLPFTSMNFMDQAGTIGFVSKLNYNISSFGTLGIGGTVPSNSTQFALTRTRNDNSADGLPATALSQNSFDIVVNVSYSV